MRWKAVGFAVVFLILIQFALPIVYPSNRVIGYRMDYVITKDHLYIYKTALEQIRKEMNRYPDKEIVIILGDSVAFSGPGPSDESIGFHMAEMAARQYGSSAPLIYNLSIPSLQAGDIYTVLLMLDKYGIPRDNVAINFRYAGFTKRNPGAPIVFWLKEQMRQLDPESFEHVLPHLEQNGYRLPETWLGKAQLFFRETVYPHMAVYKYKEFIKKDVYALLSKDNRQSDALGDTRPWYEKPDLPKLLDQPLYKNGFRTEPFDMSEANPQIYFFNKIIRMQKGTNSVFFLTGVNTELMKQYVETPGYRDNLKRIDDYFSDMNVHYVNLQGKISDREFTDHTHFTNEGYRQIAGFVWNILAKESGR